MATLTRLASTLTARYYPSQSLTDAFYLDGRLCGKRETRQADITIDKDERGFFFSVFTHPSIQGFEPGSLPPFEPQLRDLCNEVKFGHKEIDGMIEKFLSTAVDVAGTMKLSDSEVRKPYFSGVIVRDSEAFAVTIGTGLAFLYRDDTLFPLTDAGIPMEPIDAYGNRVGDFQYYCSSKTANALWSNFFTLAPDDCIILCNKAVYDALGQREILRILTDADDQCDAAGTVITQASARMPNTPMQVQISFVESVTKEEKRGLFGRKKKTKEDEEPHLITSTVEGGIVGAAAEAIADAGFVNFGAPATEAATAAAQAPVSGGIAFGDSAASSAASVAEAKVDFPDDKEAVTEVSAEEVMKNLFGQMQESSRKDQEAAQAAAEAAQAEEPAASPFVAGVDTKPAEDVIPAAEETPVKMETVSTTVFEADNDDMSPTKPVTDINSILMGAGDGILAKAIKEETQNNVSITETDPDLLKTEKPEDQVPVTDAAEPAMPFTVPSEPVKAPDVVNKADEIVFTATDPIKSEEKAPEASETFDPYGKQSSEQLMDTPPLVFGDDANAKAEAQPSENVDAIPVPDFELKEEKPEIKEEDKLDVDFPEETPVAPAPAAEPASEDQVPVSSDEFILPFADQVATVSEPEEVKTDDIPDMPLYDGGNYDTPVNAVNSEEPISAQTDSAYAYGDYNNAGQDAQSYQPYGSEAFPADEQASYGVYNQDGGTNMSDNSGFTSFGDGNTDMGGDPSYGGGYQPQYTDAENGYAQQWAPQPEQQPQYDPNQAAADITDPYSQTASASSSAKLDDDWFNNILGVDNDASGYAYSGTDAQQTQPSSAQQAQYTNPGKTAYRPAGEGPSGPTRRPQQNRPKTQGSGGSGNGGGGLGKIKLNRNGYIFFAFVGIFIICLIILIAVIAKGCSKKDKQPAESNASTSPVISESVLPTEVTAETTPAPVSDSAPIGYFHFSDYIGFRTWWDLFHYVYGIDIENNSDSRIATIITYNGLDPATYTGPNSGDRLLLPPSGVLSGEITNTFTVVGGPSTETSAATDALGNPVSTETTAPGSPVSTETSATDAVSGQINLT